jgi:signal transduction histidine kinase
VTSLMAPEFGKLAANSKRLSQKRIAPRRTILFWLHCLVVACVLPAVVVTTIFIVHSFTQERVNLERDLVGTARALSQTVDAQLIGARSALLILAMSPYLASGDLARFYEEAQQVLNTVDGDNIVLADINGQQLINTREPFGAPLPLRGNLEHHRRVIETAQPVISNIFFGAITKKPFITVGVPVLFDGKPRYGLSMAIHPERLSRILRQQKMPSDWIAAIVDSSETIVARTIGEDEFVGKKVLPTFSRALTAAGEGAFEGVTREGVSALSSFSRSATSGWTVSISIPKESLFNFLRRALLGNVLAAYVLLVAGVLLAGRISARIAGSIRALRDPAEGVGLPGPLAVPPINIQEVHELGQSLIAAHHLVDQRTAERNDLRRRIMRTQEEERLRLARDLHDQTGQTVSAAILDLKAVEPLVEENGRDRIRFLRRQLEALGHMLHRIAWELRPASIDELGLTKALENYVEEWSTKNALTVDFHCIDDKLDGRSDEIRTSIYRIIQEGLTNIAKHATNATHVSIVISTLDGTLHLTIEDNGCGFNSAASSSRLGLAGMRERLSLVGGQLEIESSPNAGTALFARIPLLTERAAA